ncbi:MAG: TetR/AcrR family transcriptional regulator [Acidimicrobiales bacterium]|jgi:AcrR family transcriptional regulator
MTSLSTRALDDAEPARQPRADSVRNRTRILEAAEEVFGSEGLAVPIDEIARRAGVGVGTIYRHFPTKEALFEAIVFHHFQRLVDTARSMADSEDAAGALFFRSLSELFALATDKRDLADALAGAGIDVKEAAGELKHELETAIAQLLARAQEEGSVRSDVSITDVMALVTSTCMNADRFGSKTCSPERMLAVVFDGLRRRD